MKNYSLPLVCSSERYNTLNVLRLSLKESLEILSSINKGYITGNKGYWLNQVKQDKKALRKHCKEIRNNPKGKV